MGDNIYLGDRNGVRTPMQWTGDRNAGFSRADPARLYAPLIMDPVYGYQAINVEAQERVAVLAAQLDEAADRAAQAVQGLRPRHARVPARDRTARSSPTCGATRTRSSCASPTSRARCSRSSSTCRAFKGMTPVEMLGLTEFPRIGELPVLPDAAGLRLLLVPPAAGARRRSRRASRRKPPRRRRQPARALRGRRRGTRCSTATSGR